MQTKLTLRMDDALVHRAKRWARMRGVSLSGAVAEFLASLPEEGRASELCPWTVRLSGAALGEKPAASDEELRKEHLNWLEAKYR